MDRQQTSAGESESWSAFRFLRGDVARRPVLPDPIRAEASSRVPGPGRHIRGQKILFPASTTATEHGGEH